MAAKRASGNCGDKAITANTLATKDAGTRACRRQEPDPAQLRGQRLQADLSQEQLAAQAGIALSTLRKIETGQVVELGYFTILAMLKVLGISANELKRQQ